MFDIPFRRIVKDPSSRSFPATPFVPPKSRDTIGCASTASPTAHGMEINIESWTVWSTLLLVSSMSPVAYRAETSGIMDVGAALESVSGMLMILIK